MTENDRIPQVLVVDDEPNIRELVQVALKFLPAAARGRERGAGHLPHCARHLLGYRHRPCHRR